MRISVNLASEPFQPTRPMVVTSTAAAVLLTATLALLIGLSMAQTGQTETMHRAIDALDGRIRRVEGEQAQLQSVLRRPENAEVLERSLFLNALLQAKGISWTRMFDDLEKVLPYNVRLISIRPQVVGENQVLLDMVVGTDAAQPVIQMLARLENSPQFGTVQLHNRIPASQGEPLRYRISVNYAQKL